MNPSRFQHSLQSVEVAECESPLAAKALWTQGEESLRAKEVNALAHFKALDKKNTVSCNLQNNILQIYCWKSLNGPHEEAINCVLRH